MVEITLSGPGKNALGTEMMRSIVDELRKADGAPVLITGAGDAFSAGLNLKEVGGLGPKEMEAFLRTLDGLYSALYCYPGPTVAAVNGHAIAGGCLVALACDVRVCTVEPKTRIGLNEVALGLQFPPGILRMIKQLVPPRWMSEVVLGAGLHGPERAKALGLVDELAEDVVTLSRERLAALAKHPADAYAAAKRALRGNATVLAEDEPALQAILPSWNSPEFKQRVAAMFTKK